MGAIALESKEARRPSWLGTFGAVIGASILAWPLTLLWAFPLVGLGLVPLPSRARAGHGWPWRIDSVWSFAADIGPLLLCGIAFAWSFEALLGRFKGSWRRPSLVLALVVAAVGWVSVVTPAQAGLVPIAEFWAFATVGVVARSVRHRPSLRLTRRGLTVLVGIGLALTGTSLAYGALHPLAAENGDVNGDTVWFALRNETRFGVRVQSVTLPGRAELRDWEGRTLVGTRIDGMESEFVSVKPSRSFCGKIERFDVRLNVAGREVRQRVWLEQPLIVPCR